MEPATRNYIPEALKGHIGDSFSPVINYFQEFPDYNSQLDANSCFLDFYSLENEIDWNLSFSSVDSPPEKFHNFDFDMKAEWMLEHDVEPIYAPILSHFIVSDWLAGQLDAEGEIIVDFFGFPVWCRNHEWLFGGLLVCQVRLCVLDVRQNDKLQVRQNDKLQ